MKQGHSESSAPTIYTLSILLISLTPLYLQSSSLIEVVFCVSQLNYTCSQYSARSTITLIILSFRFKLNRDEENNLLKLALIFLVVTLTTFLYLRLSTCDAAQCGSNFLTVDLKARRICITPTCFGIRASRLYISVTLT